MRRSQHHPAFLWRALLVGWFCLVASARSYAQPSIQFTRVPPVATGDPHRFEAIEGLVKGASPGQRVVVFAQSDEWWWVQPFADRPFTEIHPDSHWTSTTHPGAAYAALLVDARYIPPPKVHELPKRGGLVLAVAVSTSATPVAPPPPRAAEAVNRAQPSVELTVVPRAAPGSPTIVENIEGRVNGALPGQRIVLYAQSGVWWVQPLADQPFTEIQPDARWKNKTHPGSEYAALLVDSRYSPPPKINELPEKGGSVLAVATAIGTSDGPAPGVIQFGGYPWRARAIPGEAGGTLNEYDPANAWTDASGFLHLRVTRRDDKWKCAEVTLARSLGYGSYRFVVRDISRLEPAAVFIIGPAGKMDIELSHWGRPADKNAQYVIKPYIIPANTARFSAPAGILTHWMDWQPGRVTFRTARGAQAVKGRDAVAEHTFTSGVQSPGTEGMSLMAYVFGNARYPLQHGFEVIIEKFEFLP